MSSNDRKGIWSFALALLWVFFVLVGYYYFHKPLQLPQVFSLGKSLVNIIIAAGITILAGGIGRSVLPNDLPKSNERFVVQGVLGFGVLSLVWLLAGILGGFSTWIAWMFFLSGLVFFRKSALSWLQEMLNFLGQLKPSGGLEKTIFIGGLILLGIQLLTALSPPTSWDSLMYHLELPRQYLTQGKFHFVAENYYWGQTQLTEILYTWCRSLFSWETGTTLNWFMLILFLMGVFGAVQRYSRSGAWVSIAALLAGETFRLSMGSGYVDGVSALFGYAIWILAFDWITEKDDRSSIWIGVLFGLALWVKITNLILLPVLLISLLVINLWNSRAWWKGLRSLLVGILIFLPWLILLWIYTGNPFYPHIFETPWVNSARYSFFSTAGADPGLTAIWLPIAATWHGLHRVFVEGKLVFATDIGPLFLGFGLIGLVIHFKERISKLAAIWLGCGWIVMILGGLTTALLWQTRLYFVLLTPAVLLVGLGWESLSQANIGQVRLRVLLSAVIVLVLSLSLIQDLGAMARSESFGFLIGTISREDYLEKNLGWYSRATRSLYDLPGAEKILAFWEPRGFYMPDNAQADVWIDRWYMTLQENETGDEIIRNWKQENVTHVLINLSGMEYEKENNSAYQDEGWVILEEVLDSFPSPELFGDEYAVYTVR
jgi:hypothetical protein